VVSSGPVSGARAAATASDTPTSSWVALRTRTTVLAPPRGMKAPRPTARAPRRAPHAIASGGEMSELLPAVGIMVVLVVGACCLGSLLVGGPVFCCFVGDGLLPVVAGQGIP
jgi:hypothetical protein